MERDAKEHLARGELNDSLFPQQFVFATYQSPAAFKSRLLNHTMAQTPQQRRANEAYARSEASKMGRARDDLKKKSEKPQKPPISRTWVYVLLFVVCGGVLFEAFRIILGLFE